MKQTTFFAMLAASMAAMTVTTACSSEDPLSELSNYNNYQSQTQNSSNPSAGSTSATTGELASFSVAIDKSTAEPTNQADAYYPETEDNIANNSFATEIAIDLANPVSRTESGVTITANGGHITANHGSEKGICYVLSGTTTNGSFSVVGEKKYEVRLNGVNITNPDSAALNLLSSKRAYVVLTDGTANTLTDGTASQNDHKGALYCKGKLLFSGTGSLEVYGNYNNAIHSADYILFSTGNNIYAKSVANHGIKANDGIYINGGILNVEVSAAAAKGINCESHIMVNGGRTTVITTGNGTYDSDDQEAKGAACLKADSTLTVYGGELRLKSTGSGGKGINVDGAADFCGGNTYIITEGSQYKSGNDTASPKGIKVDGALNIKDGTVWVRTSGSNGEGIETKSTLTISGGQTASYAYDDAINSKSTMTITDGYVYAQGRNNDGIDANGNIYIKGGVIYAISAGGAEVAIDANTEGGYKLYLQGGTVVAVGGLEQGSQLSQSCYQASWSSNTWYALSNGSQTLAFKTPQSGGNGLVVSTASTPTLTSGVTATGGTSLFGGLAQWGTTTTGGSSVTLSSYSGGNAMGGMGGMGGGGRPGGW